MPGRLRMPAEWEPHEATWIGWPHNASDWPGKFPAIVWVYTEIARKITAGETLRILVNSERHQSRARVALRRAGVDLSRVEFFSCPTNRGWTRDFGPIFAHRTLANKLPGRGATSVKHEKSALPSVPLPGRKRGEQESSAPPAEPGAGCRPDFSGQIRASGLAIVRFEFNGWGKYPDWELDNAAAERVAAATGFPLVSATAGGSPLVLEGGSFDLNGQGALLATEECLLDDSVQPRNPRLHRPQIERAFCKYLGAHQVIWLAKGIAGDDTHGHVDDVCRFVGPRTVVLCQEDDPHDANYRPLQENRERLSGVRLDEGFKLEVVPLPMPSGLYFDGQRLPASYANFYVANAAVLVPTFNDPKDRMALGRLSEIFPDRPVVGIHAVDLVWGLGTLHCLTQQQPRALASA